MINYNNFIIEIGKKFQVTSYLNKTTVIYTVEKIINNDIYLSSKELKETVVCKEWFNKTRKIEVC